jgi:hypothetical protein
MTEKTKPAIEKHSNISEKTKLVIIRPRSLSGKRSAAPAPMNLPSRLAVIATNAIENPMMSEDVITPK